MLQLQCGEVGCGPLDNFFDDVTQRTCNHTNTTLRRMSTLQFHLHGHLQVVPVHRVLQELALLDPSLHALLPAAPAKISREATGPR